MDPRYVNFAEYSLANCSGIKILTKINSAKIITSSISVSSLTLILVFFVIVPELRRNVYSRCWILLSLTGIIHHVVFLTFNHLALKNERQFEVIVNKYCYWMFFAYFVLEFSLYLWINVLCCDVFICYM